MSRGSALAGGRRAARRGARDSCRITRTTTAVTNTTTGVVTRPESVIYEGRCRVQQSSIGGSGSEESIGAADVRLVSTQLQLPVAESARVQDGDRVTITAVSPGTDSDLVGRVYTVTGEAAKSDATSRRLALKEVTG
jgi:hypothetical protein